MNPAELGTPQGRTRFLLLHTMCRAVAGQSRWIGTLSNWALGTTAAFVSLILANLHEIQNHVHGHWIAPVFWLAVISAVVGIGIQFATAWVQIAMEVENQIGSLALDVLHNPAKYHLSEVGHLERFAPEIMKPVTDEFIESRPWAFAEMGKYFHKKGLQDPAYLAKTIASCTQRALVFLLLQYLLLGVAIFLPLGFLVYRHH